MIYVSIFFQNVPMENAFTCLKKKSYQQLLQTIFKIAPLSQFFYPNEDNTTCFSTLIIFVKISEKTTEDGENLEIKIYNKHIHNKYFSLLSVLTMSVLGLSD